MEDEVRADLERKRWTVVGRGVQVVETDSQLIVWDFLGLFCVKGMKPNDRNVRFKGNEIAWNGSSTLPSRSSDNFLPRPAVKGNLQGVHARSQ